MDVEGYASEWMAGLSVLPLLALAAGSLAVLGKGSDWLVDGASGLAYRAGLPKIIVGATIVSLGTTSPEATVSVMAAWQGEAGLALGNAIGSVIADTGLIFGLGCLMVALPADRFVLSHQGWLQFGSGVLLALLCFGTWAWLGPEARLGRGVGFLLLAGLAAYLYKTIEWSRQHRFGEPFQIDEDVDAERKSHPSVLALIGLVVLGLVVVIASSRVVISSVIVLAEVHWQIPTVVIAATLVALGTSLPELAIGLSSVRRGHGEILVGNVIGADILNVLFVVGASAAAAPLPIIDPTARVPEIVLLVHLPAMLLILGLFRLAIFRAVREGRFRRWYGVPLLAVYAIYTVGQFVIS